FHRNNNTARHYNISSLRGRGALYDRSNLLMLTGLLRPILGSSSQRQNSNVFARELATVAIY
ncbi:MAG: hypothetical protein LBG59_02810, partial [Candidatus Peribacteria bacterium]|nr:hypothetical protein [Candidatus Peribacteria bacterium]